MKPDPDTYAVSSLRSGTWSTLRTYVRSKERGRGSCQSVTHGASGSINQILYEQPPDVLHLNPGSLNAMDPSTFPKQGYLLSESMFSPRPNDCLLSLTDFELSNRGT